MKITLISKILITFICIICIFSLISTTTYANSLTEIIEKGEQFVKPGGEDSGVPTLDENSMKDMSSLIYNTLLILGVVVAVIIGTIIAIQFMTGGISEKAKVKETLIAYIAGCVVVFGGFIIWKLVLDVLSSAQ